MRKITGQSFLELRLTRAYIRLLFVPEGEDGARTVPLARFGHREVRLIELSDARTDAAPLWIELFDNNEQESIDSCACHEIEEAVQAARHFMTQASEFECACRPGDGDAQDMPGRSLWLLDGRGIQFGDCC